MANSEYSSIEIDLEIYKLIQSKRQSFHESENDILRRLLKLPQRSAPATQHGGLVIGNGVILPNGTLLRKRYKGDIYEVPVKDGKIWVHGKAFKSPSGAAVEITKSAVNGWRFWQVKRPDDVDWLSSLADLRK